METGLHIGLAAWLHDHCDRAGFPAWPAAPVGLSLASLERAENAADMAAVAEFARLVNFVVHRGQPARPFDAAAPLWRVHAALLSRMGFAERAWTEAENASFLAARATLYLPGGGMTSLYRLYQECRAAHRDLLAAGADAAALREASVAWEVEGGKSAIEAALATIERLTARSTLSRATAERAGLELLPVDPAGAAYALTGMAPLSIFDDSGWLTADVPLADLDHAVTKAPQGDAGAWSGWRQGRTGGVTFRSIVLLLNRDWFTPDLYAGDDWHLPDGGVVADGNGATGELAAYSARVYAVRDVRHVPAPTRPTKPPAGLPTLPIRPRPPIAVRLSAATVASKAGATKAVATTGVTTMASVRPLATGEVKKPQASGRSLSRPSRRSPSSMRATGRRCPRVRSWPSHRASSSSSRASPCSAGWRLPG